jgi:predicted xylose isomerase-like sugar epimerase
MTSQSTTSSGAATPGDYLLYADSYCLAAKRLFNAQPPPDGPSPGLDAHQLLPGLTLVSISIELTLKAFLVMHKWKEGQLRAISHDLKKALTKARELRFFENWVSPAQATLEADIDYLSGIYATTLVKYPNKPTEFAGKPEYLLLALELLRHAATLCSVPGLRSLVEPLGDAMSVMPTSFATSGAGRYEAVAKPEQKGESK